MRSRAAGVGRRCRSRPGGRARSASSKPSTSSSMRRPRVVRGDAPEAGVDLEVAAAGERPGRRRRPGTRPRSRRGPRSGRSRRRVRQTRAEPDVGATVVVSMPIVVDLPAPFGPSRPKTSPAATSKSIPVTASTPPGQVLVRPRTLIAGVVRVSLCSMPVTTSAGDRKRDAADACHVLGRRLVEEGAATVGRGAVLPWIANLRRRSPRRRPALRRGVA